MRQLGTIFQIQRFSVDDGPGIRTTVFLKGCPLRCIWCHNPESFSRFPQLRWHQEKCTLCGRCAQACTHGVHVFQEGRHILQRDFCVSCGECARSCPADALEVLGTQMSAGEVMREVVRDRPYYDQSGGGLTVSGGEPTFQPDFLLELLRLAKEEHLHTCVETCGFASWNFLREIVPLVDLFLFDYKATGEEIHKQFTGVSQVPILDNLNRLSREGASILLRCPIIPGYNDTQEHFAAIRRLKQQTKGVVGAEVMPYHNIGAGKWTELGLSYTLAGMDSAAEADRLHWQNMIEEE